MENVLSLKSTCLTYTSDLTIDFSITIQQITSFTTLTEQETEAECAAAGDGVKQQSGH